MQSRPSLLFKPLLKCPCRQGQRCLLGDSKSHQMTFKIRQSQIVGHTGLNECALHRCHHICKYMQRCIWVQRCIYIQSVEQKRSIVFPLCLYYMQCFSFVGSHFLFCNNTVTRSQANTDTVIFNLHNIELYNNNKLHSLWHFITATKKRLR